MMSTPLVYLSSLCTVLASFRPRSFFSVNVTELRRVEPDG